jgi:hypothetical protein
MEKEKRQTSMFSSTFFWNMQGGFFSQAWGLHRRTVFFFFSLFSLGCLTPLHLQS